MRRWGVSVSASNAFRLRDGGDETESDMSEINEIILYFFIAVT
jgi:hypothetical protein